jgi:hypothetical protein
MTDRELMQMALDALDTLGAGTSYKTHNTAKALRDRLAQPEWVGLTDEEAWECWPQTKCWDWEDFQSTWKSMEAKLKEKNG